VTFPAYRTGTHNARNIYRVAGTSSHYDDTHIACVFDPDDGELVATALSCFAAALNRATGHDPDGQSTADHDLADAIHDAIGDYAFHVVDDNGHTYHGVVDTNTDINTDTEH
jgi:hypothetical protein